MASFLGTPTALLVEAALAVIVLIALMAGIGAAKPAQLGPVRPEGAQSPAI
jgi:hypothetical protein